ncbi:hypothetical protein EKO27_g9267 [Xylaria grammica]|uniref:YCII-related domain-containing protein n=1 Tax=Xylaria grammica TaxID=363999 RepID=A0A439CUK1_9PEZI|nr:hypothetical protein EKO27_g9267 [Xylaria grammica]
MAPISTPSAGQYEWLVVVPDKAGVHEKRLEVRAKKQEKKAKIASEKITGAIFNEKPETEDASKFSFYGSTLVCVASSKEEILERLSKDIYATSGVWDLDNAQIWPVSPELPLTASAFDHSSTNLLDTIKAKFAFRNP